MPATSNNMITKTPWFCTPWLMWSLTIAFVFFQFFIQLSSGVIVKPLIKSFNINVLQASLLASSFYYIYVLLQTPAGVLVDWIGARRLLTVGGFTCGFGCLLFATSHNLTLAIIGRLLMGMGTSCAFVSALYVSAEWFPPKRFAIMVSLVEMFGMISTLLSTVYLANALEYTDWRSAMIVAAAIAASLGALCWLIIRDKPGSLTPGDVPKNFTLFWKSIIALTGKPGMWINGLYSGILFSIVTVFAALWAVPFLELAQHVSLPTATLESAFTYIGVALGTVLVGWVHSKIDNMNRLLAAAAAAATITSIIIIYFTPTSIWLGGALFFILGIAGSSYVFNYMLAKQLAPKRAMSTSIGFTNMLAVATAPILQPIIGWVLYLSNRHPATHSRLHTYELHHYHIALSLIPLCLMLAIFLAFKIPKASNK
jgi:MFS family permease